MLWRGVLALLLLALINFNIGLIILAVTIASYSDPRLRLAEDELPDAIMPDMPRADEAAPSESAVPGAAASA